MPLVYLPARSLGDPGTLPKDMGIKVDIAGRYRWYWARHLLRTSTGPTRHYDRLRRLSPQDAVPHGWYTTPMLAQLSDMAALRRLRYTLHTLRRVERYALTWLDYRDVRGDSPGRIGYAHGPAVKGKPVLTSSFTPGTCVSVLAGRHRTGH